MANESFRFHDTVMFSERNELKQHEQKKNNPKKSENHCQTNENVKLLRNDEYDIHMCTKIHNFNLFISNDIPVLSLVMFLLSQARTELLNSKMRESLMALASASSQ